MSTLVAQTAEVRWGYTMDDIDRLARRVYNRTRSNYLFDQSDRYSAAWFGIVEHLFESVELPTPADLIQAGTRRVGDESRLNQSFYGYRADMPNKEAPRFVTYWRRGGQSDFTDRIAEREALPKVLAVLNTTLYEAIVTLAAFDNMSDAARALGISDKAFEHRIKRARAALISAWFAPEHPPVKGNGYGDTCRAGHSRAEHSYKNARGANVCRECMRVARRRSYYKLRDAALSPSRT